MARIKRPDADAMPTVMARADACVLKSVLLEVIVPHA